MTWVTEVTQVTWVTRVTWVTSVTRLTGVTTVTCVTRVTWVTCVTMMSGLLFSRMTRVFKYEDKLVGNLEEKLFNVQSSALRKTFQQHSRTFSYHCIAILWAMKVGYN